MISNRLKTLAIILKLIIYDQVKYFDNFSYAEGSVNTTTLSFAFISAMMLVRKTKATPANRATATTISTTENPFENLEFIFNKLTLDQYERH